MTESPQSTPAVLPLDPKSRRRIGNTDLFVSPIAFGCSSFTDLDSIKEQQAIDSVLEAVKLGINFFDVSPYYGCTRAETVLGKALRQLPRDSFIVSTKVGRYDLHKFDFSHNRVIQSVEQSMKRLALDTIDIIQCHDIEFVDLHIIVNETIPALLQLKKAGKVRAIGISGYPLEIFPYVLAALPPSTIDVVLSYCNYCLQNERLSGLFHFFERTGITVINASPLSMGLLTSRGPPEWHPADEQIKSVAKSAVTFCHQRGVDVSNIGMQFALQANPKVIVTTLVGIDSVSTLHKNLSAFWQAPDNVLIAQVRGVFDPVRNRTWSSGRISGSES